MRSKSSLNLLPRPPLGTLLTSSNAEMITSIGSDPGLGPGPKPPPGLQPPRHAGDPPENPSPVGARGSGYVSLTH